MAKMLRTSSSTISTVRPASASVEEWSRRTIACLSSGSRAASRCRKSAVSSNSRSSERTCFRTMRDDSARSSSSAEAQSSPGP